MGWIATTLITVLFGLAAVHAYWALGGRWPGHDDASLVERVVGRTSGMRAPSSAATFAVAGALLAAATLVGLRANHMIVGDAALILAVAYWVAALVFFGRGVAGYVPAFFRYAEGTPFHGLNRRVYSPLCLAIAAAFVGAG